MPVKVLAIVLGIALGIMPAGVDAKDSKMPAGSQQNQENEGNPSFRELLEFLGQWETDDGNWVDPTDLDWLMMPEQGSKNNEKKKP